MKLSKIKKGKCVVVYDMYRFAIPLKAIIIRKSESNDNDVVKIKLLESNNTFYPINCTVWVSCRQLRKCKS